MARFPFRVIWSVPAARDLEGILERIEITIPAMALKLLSRFRKTVSCLHSMPERGRIVPELLDHGVSLYRELILAPWRVVYRVQGREVFVLLVVDGRRNVEDILLERLTR